ncbi:signal peptidase I [Euzebya tangerina]|uniref:signal peptidase I n=1 Tax=Euzebya tangerina TaxID=591198 RepID=UPI0013C2C025|nr:signal peptidase I [Euzebya tangerina]
MNGLETTTDDSTDSRADADPQPESAAAGRRPGLALTRFFAELPGLIIVALVLAFLLKTFVIQAFYIPSASMEPTLQVGDRVLVTKLAYLYREPERGEIVVFREEEVGPTTQGNIVGDTVRSFASGLGLIQPLERDFIKRIIGLPGDEVEMRGGVVLINGDPLPESLMSDGGYLAERDLNDFGPVTVEADHYFVMGDNRPNSSDSRFSLGQIDADQLLGRAFVTIWPIDGAGSLPIAEYEE